ncbi:MAG: FkbM family methyltransferase [Nitrospirae bacterium]|nr:FkbM family methyltransferase [Nitrospirota bacterium]
MRTSEILFASARNVTAILRNERGALNKLTMFFLSLRLAMKMLILCVVPGIRIKSERFHGYTVRFHDYETFWGLFNEIFIHKEYAFETSNKTPLIIDCGSNFGLSVLFFKKYYPGSKIIAFEPHAETFELLKDNVERNGLAEDVTLINAALNNSEGESVFYSDLDKTTTTGMSLTTRLHEKGKRIKEETVASVLLSEYINGEVDLLKMDIEGTETAALRELADRSKIGSVKEMVIEYHYDKGNPENDLAGLLALLKGEGFRYIIHAAQKPPYHLYRNKPYSLIVYAYR